MRVPTVHLYNFVVHAHIALRFVNMRNCVCHSVCVLFKCNSETRHHGKFRQQNSSMKGPADAGIKC